MAEAGAAMVGLLQSIQYLLYSVYPDIHWSLWQLIQVPFAIVLSTFSLLFLSAGEVFRTSVVNDSATDVVGTNVIAANVVAVLLVGVLDVSARLSRTFAAMVVVVVASKDQNKPTSINSKIDPGIHQQSEGS